MPLDLVRFAAADGGEPVRRVLDVGANDGGTSLGLAKWFPAAEFHAFEPIGSTYSTLVRRVSSHPRITPHRLACGANCGEVTVKLRDHDAINTLRDAERRSTEFPDRPGASETVSVTTVDAHCQAYGWDKLDLLKTDTEGFDLEVLRGAEAMVSRGAVRFVYCEVGFHGQENQTSYCEVSTFLRDRGFQLAGFYEEWRAGVTKELMPFANALFVGHK